MNHYLNTIFKNIFSRFMYSRFLLRGYYFAVFVSRFLLRGYYFAVFVSRFLLRGYCLRGYCIRDYHRLRYLLLKHVTRHVSHCNSQNISVVALHIPATATSCFATRRKLGYAILGFHEHLEPLR